MFILLFDCFLAGLVACFSQYSGCLGYFCAASRSVCKVPLFLSSGQIYDLLIFGSLSAILSCHILV